jgi:hypothetical protein
LCLQHATPNLNLNDADRDALAFRGGARVRNTEVLCVVFQPVPVENRDYLVINPIAETVFESLYPGRR